MSVKFLLATGVSGLLLVLVYSTIDVRHLIEVLSNADPWRLLIALALLLALLGLSAIRFIWLAQSAGLDIGFALSLRATFAANALNLFIPGKLGDLAKASMLRKSAHDSILTTLPITIYEKLADAIAVLILGAAALIHVANPTWLELILIVCLSSLLLSVLISPVLARVGLVLLKILPMRLAEPLQRLGSSWLHMLAAFSSRPRTVVLSLTLTLAIWVGHLFQIALMAWALGVTGPWIPFLAVLPVVILSGVMPLTIAGIGARDAVMVALVGPLIGAAPAAALSLLFLLRFLVPGIIGLAFMPEFSRSIRRA